LGQHAEMEKLEMNLRALAQTPAEQQENTVFLSGSGPRAAVVVLANRKMLVTIPFGSRTAHYSISVSTVSSDGKTVWSNHVQESSNSGSLTMGAPVLAPGSYTLTALVKDTDGSTQKTYVVNFSVKQ
jgi:hypothetical protein